MFDYASNSSGAGPPLTIARNIRYNSVGFRTHKHKHTLNLASQSYTYISITNEYMQTKLKQTKSKQRKIEKFKII